MFWRRKGNDFFCLFSVNLEDYKRNLISDKHYLSEILATTRDIGTLILSQRRLQSKRVHGHVTIYEALLSDNSVNHGVH